MGGSKVQVESDLMWEKGVEWPKVQYQGMVGSKEMMGVLQAVVRD